MTSAVIKFQVEGELEGLIHCKYDGHPSALGYTLAQYALSPEKDWVKALYFHFDLYNRGAYTHLFNRKLLNKPEADVYKPKNPLYNYTSPLYSTEIRPPFINTKIDELPEFQWLYVLSSKVNTRINSSDVRMMVYEWFGDGGGCVGEYVRKGHSLHDYKRDIKDISHVLDFSFPHYISDIEKENREFQFTDVSRDLTLVIYEGKVVGVKIQTVSPNNTLRRLEEVHLFQPDYSSAIVKNAVYDGGRLVQE